MVNRVNGNDYYDYTKLNLPSSSDMAGSGEKFSLDYQRADDKKDEEEGKEKISKEELGKGLAGNEARTVMQGGVRLELSEKSREKGSAGQTGLFSDLFGAVRSWIAAFVQSFKGVLDRIWNDPEPEEEVLSAEEVPLEETDRLSEEYLSMNPLEDRNPDRPDNLKREEETVPVSGIPGDSERAHLRNLSGSSDTTEQSAATVVNREQEIQKYLRSGNLEQVISLLTENGQRTIARNSSLLTYYDRTGKLTSLSASDQERILHGDRNTRKL